MLITNIDQIPKNSRKGSSNDVRGLTLSDLEEFVDRNVKYGVIKLSVHHTSKASICQSIRYHAKQYGMPIQPIMRQGIVYIARTDMGEIDK